MKSELVLPSLINDSETEYTLFRYIKPKSCTSCQLQMGKWRIYKRRLEKKYGDRVRLFFLIDTSVPDEVQKLIEIYKFKNNSIIDSTHNFVKANPLIKQFEDELIMLLDRNDKIILIGNPFENTKIDSLYRQIID